MTELCFAYLLTHLSSHDPLDLSGDPFVGPAPEVVNHWTKPQNFPV